MPTRRSEAPEADEREALSRELARTRAELEATRVALSTAVDFHLASMKTMETLRRIAGALAAAEGPEQVCRSVVQAVAEELRLERCSLLLVEPGGSSLKLWAGASVHDPPGACEARSGRSFEIGEGIAGAAARLGRTVLVADVTQDPRWSSGPGEGYVRSLLCEPLFAGGRLLGVLNVSHPEPGHFDDSHVRLFGVMGPILGQFLRLALERNRD